jgi:alpha-maltose-1-phosphate synthase
LPLTITLAHAGKQHSYYVARSLQQLGHLDRFYTSSYVAPAWLQRRLATNNFWNRRFLPGLAAPQVQANWRLELQELYLRRRYGKTARAQEAVYARDMAFDAFMARRLPGRPSQWFWGFQGSCYQSLEAARQAGKGSICELSTAHITESIRILGEEQRLHPEWADSLDNLVFPPEYARRLAQEPHRADIVVAASQFTRQTLLADGIADNKIVVLPLGFDMEHVPYVPRPESDRLSQRPLRLLYAGTLTQRKGLKYLMEVMKRLNTPDITLTCIGHVQGSGQALQAYKPWFSHRPAVSQAELFGLYGEYDALVLPTIFEGFGLVIVEAMAAGLPVITTPHSMGPDLITEGYNGYLVPIRDERALEQAIVNLRQLGDAQYLAMRSHAHHSVQRYSWAAYAGNLRNFIHSRLL